MDNYTKYGLLAAGAIGLYIASKNGALGDDAANIDNTSSIKNLPKKSLSRKKSRRSKLSGTDTTNPRTNPDAKVKAYNIDELWNMPTWLEEQLIEDWDWRMSDEEREDLSQERMFELQQEQAFTVLEGDPDIIRMDGQRAGYFADLTNFQTKEKAIVYLSVRIREKKDGKMEDLLESFWTPNYKKEWELIEDGSWNDFDSQETAIAYRGGSGYIYTIWKKI